MPIIYIQPKETSRMKLRGTLKTPVYITQERNNVSGNGIIFDAHIPTDDHQSHWVLQSVALVLNVDY